MSVADKYNKEKLFDFDTPEDFEYKALSDLFNDNGEAKVYPVKALYINTKSRYGDAPVIVTDTCLVNVPSHMTDTVKQMLADREAVDDINAGKVGFTIYQYEAKKRSGKFFNVKWVDL